MTEQNPQDSAPNQDAIVAAYSPEMLEARDELTAAVNSLREKMSALDTQGELPPRTGYRVFDNGTIILDFGSYSDDFNEAISQYSTQKEFAEITGSTESLGEITVVTINNADQTEPVDPELPVLEEPVIKIETTKTKEEGTELKTLSIYKNGYVEKSSEATRTEFVHPTDASDFVKQYAQPNVRQEITVRPSEINPAEVEDVQATQLDLINTAARFGINY